MADYQHFTNFNLTDTRTGKTKNLTDDYGGTIINTNQEVYERECMPQLNFITDKNENRDGEIFIKSTYGIRTIDMSCFFSEKLGGGDLFELKKWLGKKYQQRFSWEGDDEDKEILVIESGNWKSQVHYQEKFYGKIDLKFVAHNPYWYKPKERDITFKNTDLVIGKVNNIRCGGNSESFPLIKITPNGTQNIIKFQLNELTITLTNVDKPIYIDCEKHQCYENVDKLTVLRGLKYQSNKFIDFPTIYGDNKNYIKLLEGSVESMVITLNSRII